MHEPFALAVERHGPTIARVCRAVLGATADADDAWAETFLAALGAWPELDEHANVQAWLVTIAHRKCIDIGRAESRRALPMAQLPEPSVVTTLMGLAPPPSPDSSEQLDSVWGLVASLPPRQRLAVAYHYFGGLPHRDTAELIGATPDAVRRAAADGIRTLRRRLQHHTADARPSPAIHHRPDDCESP